jgi:hypothetical protein
MTVRPWIWIATSSSVSVLLSIASVLLFALPLVSGKSSVVQLAAGALSFSYFGLLSLRCLKTKLVLHDGFLTWHDPFSSGRIDCDDLSAINVVIVRTELVWIPRPRISYSGLALHASDGAASVTVAASMLTRGQRRRLYLELDRQQSRDAMVLRFSEHELTAGFENVGNEAVRHLSVRRLSYNGPFRQLERVVRQIDR